MIDVKQTLKDAESKMQKASNFLAEELARVRAGRANVAILDGVRVESYGQMVPLNQVANVQVSDARTITIRPWDRKQIRDIEKGIIDSEVGVTPENNGEMVILRLPQPTEERRKELVKQCNKIGEQTKVQIRNIRADIKDKLKKAVKMVFLRIWKRMQKQICRRLMISLSRMLMQSSLTNRKKS